VRALRIPSNTGWTTLGIGIAGVGSGDWGVTKEKGKKKGNNAIREKKKKMGRQFGEVRGAKAAQVRWGGKDISI